MGKNVYNMELEEIRYINKGLEKVFTWMVKWGCPLFVTYLIAHHWVYDYPLGYKIIWTFGCITNGYLLWWFMLGKEVHYDKTE